MAHPITREMLEWWNNSQEARQLRAQKQEATLDRRRAIAKTELPAVVAEQEAAGVAAMKDIRAKKAAATKEFEFFLQTDWEARKAEWDWYAESRGREKQVNRLREELTTLAPTIIDETIASWMKEVKDVQPTDWRRADRDKVVPWLEAMAEAGRQAAALKLTSLTEEEIVTRLQKIRAAVPPAKWLMRLADLVA